MPGPPSPFDDPVPRGYPVVLATLRIAVAVLCWGWAAARLQRGEDFGLVAGLTRFGGLTQPLAEMALRRVAQGLIVCGLLTLVRPCWPVLLPVTVWFGFVAACGPLVSGDPLRPAIDSVRVAAPLALLLLDLWPPAVKFSLGRAMVGLGLLRLGAVGTFAGIGVRALQQARTGGPLSELLAACLRQVLRLDPTPAQAQGGLGIVGGLLIGLALGMLLVRSRMIAALMTLTALGLSLSCVVGGGPGAYPRALLHIADAGVPATLGLYWLLAVKEQPAITLPADRR